MKQEGSKASPDFRRVMSQAGLRLPEAPDHSVAPSGPGAGNDVLPRMLPGAVHTPTLDQFYRAKALLSRGEIPALDHVGFFTAAYSIQRGDEHPRLINAGRERSALLDHARAGVRILAQEFKETNNQAGLGALARLVEWPSAVISARDRAELLPGKSQISKAPDPTASRTAADPFDDRFSKLEHWDGCLTDFLMRNSALSERDALEAAAKRLTAQFSANHLLALEQAAAGNPELSKLRSVLSRGRELLGDRTVVA